jgi:hypothetical protein
MLLREVPRVLPRRVLDISFVERIDLSLSRFNSLYERPSEAALRGHLWCPERGGAENCKEAAEMRDSKCVAGANVASTSSTIARCRPGVLLSSRN